MSLERKRQIWLRPDQCDLVGTALRYFDNELRTTSAYSAYMAAGKFTRRRINEVLDIIDPEKTSGPI